LGKFGNIKSWFPSKCWQSFFSKKQERFYYAYQFSGKSLMPEPLSDQIILKIEQAAEFYHRLVMLVAPAGGGKAAALQDVHARTAAPLVNVNLELSRRMLDLTERQRALQLPCILAEIVGASAAEVILLDNVASQQPADERMKLAEVKKMQ
jgi:hypothetical protein